MVILYNKYMIGKQIGNCQVLSELGRSGYATVYLASHPIHNTKVAIKVYPREFLRLPKFKPYFEVIANKIIKLEHPAIVSIFDSGEQEEGLYLVMRYMFGGSLRDKIKDENLSLSQVVELLKRIIPALDHAHRNGVIHGRLKPSNILFDEFDQPYLSDFGMAGLIEEVGGQFEGIGLMHYKSPEQVLGKQPLDSRTDFYSLGVIVFQLLTGMMPNESGTMVGLIYQHLEGPIPNILDFNPSLPPEIGTIITKATAKDREDRYSRGGELLEALSVLNEREKRIVEPSIEKKSEDNEESKDDPLLTRISAWIKYLFFGVLGGVLSAWFFTTFQVDGSIQEYLSPEVHLAIQYSLGAVIGLWTGRNMRSLGKHPVAGAVVAFGLTFLMVDVPLMIFSLLFGIFIQ